VVGASRYPWSRLPSFVQGGLRREGWSSAQARAAGTGFWFDRDYAAFLEAVRASTPPASAVAVVIPEEPPAYLYQAAFTLAPRRVVVLKDGLSPAYVAYYKEAGALSQAQGARIPFGVLVRR
jgi:hypothetical protein